MCSDEAPNRYNGHSPHLREVRLVEYSTVTAHTSGGWGTPQLHRHTPQMAGVLYSHSPHLRWLGVPHSSTDTAHTSERSDILGIQLIILVNVAEVKVTDFIH